MGMTKAVKLADIAEQLNVSTVTVSKALADKSGVSEEMRTEIKRLAQELGYKTPSAKQLGKEIISRNLGVLVSEIYLEKYSSFYWELYRHIATQTTRKDHFSMLEELRKADELSLTMPKIITEKKVDGLIVLGKLREEYLKVLEQEDIPLVFLDFYDGNHRCDSVVSNNYYGMYLMTNYLFEKGHKDIGFVGSIQATSSIADRYFGYCKSMLEHGVTPKEKWILDDREAGSGKIIIEKLPGELPTAFACNCDLAAGELIRLLGQKGYKVPEDISVVGFDNYIFPGITDVEITTYEVDVKGMAKLSINTLIKKINKESYKEGISIVEGRLVEKNSVKIKK